MENKAPVKETRRRSLYLKNVARISYHTVGCCAAFWAILSMIISHLLLLDWNTIP